MRLVALGGGLWCAVFAIAACTGLDGLAGGDAPNDGGRTGDGARDNPCGANLDGDHDNCGACGAVCAAMEHCLTSKCAPGCPDHVVYVSADGNDNASGCAKASPKRTIGAAIALLKTLSAQQHEVHVCRGQYPGSVVLDYPASILGAYECSTWTRSAGYGAPTFDGVNESVVIGDTGPAVTAAKVSGLSIDGLTMRSTASVTTTRSVAVLVTDLAQAKIANSKVLSGAAATADSPASVGLFVDKSGYVQLENSIVDGGAGKNSGGGYGSAGVFLADKGGSLIMKGARVDGGSGSVTGGTGSVGILALGSTEPTIIERSTINGGKGRTGAGSASYGIGYFARTDLDLSGSIIDGGAGACSATCASNGVSISTSGKVRVHGNRITGGEADPDVADDIEFNGLHLSDFASADVQNNFIFTGNTKATFSSGGVALEITRGGAALVAGNTLAVGPTKSLRGSAIVAFAKDATFANNLILMAANAAVGNVVDLDACNGRTYALHNNVWAGFKDGSTLLRFTRSATPACPATPPLDVTADALEADARATFGAARVSGNARVINLCGGDTRCNPVAACATATGCLGSVLAGWDPKTAGDLLGSGWKLATGVTCAISHGGSSTVPGLLAADGFGAGRTAPRAIGAHEHEGACQ